MQGRAGGPDILPPRTAARKIRHRQARFSRVLLLLSALLMAAVGAYVAVGRVARRAEARDRYLRIEGLASVAPALVAWSASPTALPTAMPEPTPAPVLLPTEPASAEPTEVIVPLPTATFFTRPDSTQTPTASPLELAAPTSTPTPAPPLAVRIRIPAIGVDRSIVELPPTLNAKTGAYELPLKTLFRRPGTDLVGHWVGSASPGQPGNMILVGHNFGYGYNGVFVHVARLHAGQVVYVVNQAGETFSYGVTHVERIRWSKKSAQELQQHQAYLSVSGDERVTLVTCGGAEWEPFPDRIYVVAERVE